MSPLRAALEEYLRIRRSLGFKLEVDGKMLEDFIAFLERAGATRVTTELALDWAKLPRDAHPYHWRKRLGVVRLFARYLATIDPRTEIPSKDLLPATRRRLAPYIYSPAEIAALMSAARALSPPSRAATIETLIGLMAATGLRLGEALRLDRADADLDDGCCVSMASSARSGRWRCTRAPLARCADTSSCEAATGRRRTPTRCFSPGSVCGSPSRRPTMSFRS